jgi:predicted O-methyltransferase YrrM
MAPFPAPGHDSSKDGSVDLEHLTAAVAGIPHMTPERGQEIYAFVRKQQPESVLELGFAHGVSSCYIGAALKANGATGL